MRIVKRKEFLTMPAGTLFSKYEPCIFGELCIKGETWNNDFLVQHLVDAVDAKDSGEYGAILDRAENEGASVALDFHCQGRDGCFDGDEVLFAVWEPADMSALIARLQQAASDAVTNEPS